MSMWFFIPMNNLEVQILSLFVPFLSFFLGNWFMSHFESVGLVCKGQKSHIQPNNLFLCK